MSVAEEIRQQAKIELRHARMLINGAWVGSMSGEMLTVENPAKRRPIAAIPRGDAADVYGAVEAAARAFPGWSKVVPRDRGRLLLRIAEAMEARTQEIAHTIALETGNALRTKARGEARLSADILMNNAGVSSGGGPWDHYDGWQRVLSVNLWGVINGVQTFTQAMIDQVRRAPSSTPAPSRASPPCPAIPPTTSPRPG